MKLTIITINYNNASGLQKTMESVLSQTSSDFEYIVVDGSPGSPKAGVQSDAEVRASFTQEVFPEENGFHPCVWKSSTGTITGGYYAEPDQGIYNAMNKGIRKAQGEYIQFLNSSDVLAAGNVTERMIAQLSIIHSPLSIIYGNMLKPYRGKILRDQGFAGRQPTMLDFYRGTLNHSPAYIGRNLFEKYGLYDETLKIVSDWKWYMQAMIWGGEKIQYIDIDVTVFDMAGISNSNKTLENEERKAVLNDMFPPAVLMDYEKWSFPILQLQRINQYWIPRSLVYFLERLIFEIERLREK